MRQLKFTIAATAVLLATTACASPRLATGLPGSSTLGADVPNQAAMAAWANFPVDAIPRRLLVGALPLVPERGFADGNNKAAVLAGNYHLATSLPAAPHRPLDVLLPEGRFTFAAVTARQAFDAMSTKPPNPTEPTARIMAVTLASATFSTDRGPHLLPAWLFTLDGESDPLAWPAIAESAFWRLKPTMPLIGMATIDRNGDTLTLHLPALPPPCPGTRAYHAEAESTETPTAIGIGLRVISEGIAPGESTAGCPVYRMDMSASYTVQLMTPLGNRVVLAPVGAATVAVLDVHPSQK